MDGIFRRPELNRFTRWLWLAFLLAALTHKQTQGATIVSVNPTNGASNVSTSSNVVFAFSTPMYTAATQAIFTNATTGTVIFAVQGTWNGSGTVLTCAPTLSWPANSTISWFVLGIDATFQPLTGPTSGSFSTGSGSSGGTGSGTNTVTTFLVGKTYSYDQLSTAAPTLDTNAPFLFNATTTLASNRPATAVTLTLPNSVVTNLTRDGLHPEDFSYFYFTTSSNTLETAYPAGSYTFTVTASSSNQTVGVPLSASTAQPNAPHIANFAAAQSVNASAAFTLSWDPFVTGTAADYIYVVIGNNVWKTADPGTGSALHGTATSVAIPAGALQANANYISTIGFYRFNASSNATYATVSYRASFTRFNLNTAGTASLPVITNVVSGGASLSFDIETAPGQTVSVVRSTDCSLPMAQWQTVWTTNSPGTRVHIVVSPPGSGAQFYRARNGS